MIRYVAYRKAVLAGMAGAVAWEAVARPLILAGVPFVDIVGTLGSGASACGRMDVLDRRHDAAPDRRRDLGRLLRLLLLVCPAASPRAPRPGVRIRADAAGHLHHASAARAHAPPGPSWPGAFFGPVRVEPRSA